MTTTYIKFRNAVKAWKILNVSGGDRETSAVPRTPYRSTTQYTCSSKTRPPGILHAHLYTLVTQTRAQHHGIQLNRCSGVVGDYRTPPRSCGTQQSTLNKLFRQTQPDALNSRK